MKWNTKLFKLLLDLKLQIQKKRFLFEKKFTISIFFLFFGFVCGNLFGTFLNFFRNYTNWDGVIISSTILFIEFINYLNYKENLKKKKFKLKKFKNYFNIKFKNLQMIRVFNFYKIGLLLGFFTDAFKVGVRFVMIK